MLRTKTDPVAPATDVPTSATLAYTPNALAALINTGSDRSNSTRTIQWSDTGTQVLL
jgi:hypothetical protein